MKTIQVRYFAALREATKKSDEKITTEAVTVSSLFKELNERYNFPLQENQVRFAVNKFYQNHAYNLTDGDEVVFIPPVAGG